MDNTTVFGARRAFEWDPGRQWGLPTGVDLRSLMDILEAIVLVEEFAVDHSSREGSISWRSLHDVSQANGGFFRERTLLTETHAVLVETSAVVLQQLLRTGQLAEHLGSMPSTGELEALPQFYRDGTHFVDLTTDGFDFRTEAAALDELHDLVHLLRAQTQAVRNFAFFAYRGFYYHHMAYAAGASYMPHAWRSQLISSQLAAPQTRFSDHVMDEVVGIRNGVRAQIHEGFGEGVGGSALSADFPLIASYVVGQCTTRESLLRTAAEVRRSAKATALRTWMHSVELKLRREEDLVGIREAQEQLRTLVHELALEFGLAKGEKQQVTLKAGVPLASAETTVQVPRGPRVLRRVPRRRRPHLVFLRELARESARLAPFALAFQRLAP